MTFASRLLFFFQVKEEENVVYQVNEDDNLFTNNVTYVFCLQIIFSVSSLFFFLILIINNVTFPQKRVEFWENLGFWGQPGNKKKQTFFSLKIYGTSFPKDASFRRLLSKKKAWISVFFYNLEFWPWGIFKVDNDSQWGTFMEKKWNF